MAGLVNGDMVSLILLDFNLCMMAPSEQGCPEPGARDSREGQRAQSHPREGRDGQPQHSTILWDYEHGLSTIRSNKTTSSATKLALLDLFGQRSSGSRKCENQR
jgi:hypothetical protein